MSIFLLLVLAATARVGTLDVDSNRGWHVVHDGYGKVGVEAADTGQMAHVLQPTISRSVDETHAALAISDASYGDLALELGVRTVQQLRTGSPPNPWEMAWVVWHYTDDEHFYYLILKPNGWELGKRDPSYPGGQRFLVSDADPAYLVNTWYQVRVEQAGQTMSVVVDGRTLARYEDTERPYLDGEVGLYTEDAYAQFSDIRVDSLPADRPAPRAS